MSMYIDELELSDERVSFAECKPLGWGGFVKINDFYKALNDAGVPPALWPNLPTDNKCCGRAVKDVKPPNKRVMARPLPNSRGWSIVFENEDALDLEAAEELRRCGAGDAIEESHRVELTVKVERAEDDEHLSTIRCHPEDHPGVPLVHQSFRFFRGTDDENLGMFMCSEDLSVWFSQTIIPWCRAVATRSRGGSYYVLREHFPRIQAVQAAIEAVSEYDVSIVGEMEGKQLRRTAVVTGGRIMLKPEVPTIAAVELLIDSIVNEVDKEIDVLDGKLRTGGQGGRALDTQASKVDSLGDKLKEFEDLLGIGLTDVRNRLAESEAGVGMARLKIEAEKESRDAA